MTIEATIVAALKGLVPGQGSAGARVFPNVAPANTALPYIVYTRAGGKPLDDLDLDGSPDTKNVRMQIDVWSDRYLSADRIMTSVGAILTSAPISGTSLGEPTSQWEDATKLHGFRQDFSIFYTP